MSKRAQRRHHYQRLKSKRKNYWNHGYNTYETTEEVLSGKVVDTPKVCSCYMCGNPRKYFKEKTRQEKKFELEYCQSGNGPDC